MWYWSHPESDDKPELQPWTIHYPLPHVMFHWSLKCTLYFEDYSQILGIDIRGSFKFLKRETLEGQTSAICMMTIWQGWDSSSVKPWYIMANIMSLPSPRAVGASVSMKLHLINSSDNKSPPVYYSLCICGRETFGISFQSN